ncbi:MAG: hypothetical protein CO022_06235 [Flavobacteriales bacterium CG_4_9_14_0_2_um_filter_32_27]|nr:MAG: hypothetical protein CO022_06235 [Flavobacteriales bacterium CG_4_9_14_0_2_um_filter_32_27]
MFKKIFISFLLLAFALGLFAQNDKNKEDGARQALFIYNFSKYIEWSNFNSLKEFKIGVIGDEYNYVYDELIVLSKTKDVKGIPIKIERVNYDTKLDELQLIYFDNSENTSIKDLYKKTKGNPVLLVGKEYPFGQSMINFLDVNDKIEFELNEEKCNKAGLKVNVVIKTIAIKTKREWDSLLEKMETITLQNENKVQVNTKDLEAIIAQQKQLEKEIEAKKVTLAAQNEKLEQKVAEIKEKEQLIEASTIELIKQKELVDIQNKKIASQQQNLSKLNYNVVSNQIKLAEQQEKLEKDQAKLKVIKEDVTLIEKELQEKEAVLARNEKLITLQNSELVTKSSKIEQQKHIIWISVLFLIIVSILGLVAYRSYKLKNKANLLVTHQKLEIENQHKEIIDSITYAKRLQEAIFPTLSSVKEFLPQSFIFFKPKDVVSGDFYWMETSPTPTLPKGEGDSPPPTGGELEGTCILFAVADCTGHGVPGAMVSVVCNNALNRSVREYGITKPGEILDKTREIVVGEFAKSNEDVKDGMDISLCSLQLSESCATLHWSGANNSLYIIRPTVGKTFELIEIKPNKQSIGKIDNPEAYSTHTFELMKGDTLYLFTDGYADQFGGEKGKKLMYKPFKQMLLEFQEKSMEEQQEILEKHFENWRGDLEQVDDVCVIGVRI